MERAMAGSHDRIHLIGPIRNIETIATGSAIREVANLRRLFGGRNWRKLKGIAIVQLETGTTRLCEVHWYEAHGIGKRKLKIKNFLD
jgi:hypothetical protein